MRIERKGIFTAIFQFHIIQNCIIENRKTVIAKLNRSRSIETKDVEAKVWLFDILIGIQIYYSY